MLGNHDPNHTRIKFGPGAAAAAAAAAPAGGFGGGTGPPGSGGFATTRPRSSMKAFMLMAHNGRDEFRFATPKVRSRLVYDWGEYCFLAVL